MRSRLTNPQFLAGLSVPDSAIPAVSIGGGVVFKLSGTPHTSATLQASPLLYHLMADDFQIDSHPVLTLTSTVEQFDTQEYSPLITDQNISDIGTFTEISMYELEQFDTQEYVTGITDDLVVMTSAPPGGVTSGLTAWWDPSDKSGITHSTSNVVTIFADKARNKQLTVPGTRVGPVTNTRTINGLNALDFNGSSTAASASALSCPAFLTTMATWTVYIVYSVDADPSDDNLGSLFMENGSGFTELGLRYTTQYPNALWVSNGPTVKANVQHTAEDVTTGGGATPHLATVKFSLAGMSVATDGDSGTSTGALTSAMTGNTTFSLGTILDANGPRAHNGLIGEILIYDTVHDGTTTDTVEAALMTKWGII